jgi:hypothetical protein
MTQIRRIFLALAALCLCSIWCIAAELADSKEPWWSLKPLSRPMIPKTKVLGGSPANLIDAFIWAKLEEKGLSPSPEADRRTLIRRVSFDLTGLPPTPQEVESFVNDQDPDAYEHLVDRLLNSPRYGERWARHWLDVVHYGDTHGYDKDKPRPYAWTYRDYVIRAFNEDKPYGRFVQEQLAGDVLFPDTADGIEALGFISAGPWDFVGHEEVSEMKTDGKIARHLDRDDMISNTINTFNSLTVQCAQCHNHKFDPIPTEDYYNLQSVFAAVDRTTREYYRDRGLNHKRTELRSREWSLLTERNSLEEKINKAGGDELEKARKKYEAALKPSDKEHHAQYGYHSAIETSQLATKWVQVDLGSAQTLTNIVLRPCWDDFAGIGDGFGFPIRFKVEAADDVGFKSGVTTLLDQTTEDFPNPGIKPQTIALHNLRARYIRVTATKLAPRSGDYILALAELEAYNAAGKNVARDAAVTALDSIEAPVRWAKQNLVDGIYPGAQIKRSQTEIAELKREYELVYEKLVTEELRNSWKKTTNSLAQVKSEIDAMPKPNLAYVGAVHFGNGLFRGTGPDGGRPRAIYVLNRGDVRKPANPAHPGALSCVSGISARFELNEDAPEGARRAALAKWITDDRNPLTWRSIVNRVWQYHFGRGIVETPNDFGKMGRLPTHPELLDWLAVEFRDSGQSLKKLQKLIVTSATYKQVSNIEHDHLEAAKLDGDNRLLWRMNRRKLEAEAIRDSVLFVSGKLDLSMYGPGFQDFVIEKPEHSPHYEYDQYNPNDPKTHRRSIYRFIVRSQQQPFMTTLDCADPSMLVDKRNESLSPLQALALLNDKFMVAMAAGFAARLDAECTSGEQKIEIAFRECLGRSPAPSEKQELLEFAQRDGLANTCRLLFNLNEFIFVD